MAKPRFVQLNTRINTRRIAVQKWERTDDAIVLGTAVRGENLGQELLAQVENRPVSLHVDDEDYSGVAHVLDHRIAGEGGTAVHRITIRIALDGKAQAKVLSEMTTDEKLDLLIAEVAALRQEVAQLRKPQPMTNPAGPTGTQTLLDFDLGENLD